VKHILVAVDGSDHAQRAIDLASDIAQKYDAELVLVHVIDDRPLSESARRLAEIEFGEKVNPREGMVVDPVVGARYAALGQLEEQETHTTTSIKRLLGQRILENAKNQAKEHGARHVATVIEDGDPAHAILKAGEDCEANLIVIGSRGLSDIKSLMLGSVSHKVANQSPVNVITVR